MSRLLLGYVAAQIILLPLSVLSFWVAPGRGGVRFAWRLHRLLLLLNLALPVLLLFWPRAGLLHALPPLAVSAALPLPEAAQATSAALANAAVVVSARGRLPPGAIASLTAIALSAGGLLVFAVRFARQKRLEARLVCRGSIRRFGRIRVVVSPDITIPFSAGIVRSTVFMPEEMARNRYHREMIIAHEGEHLRGLHYLWTVGETFLASLFWFNPLAHLLALDGVRIRELLCDQAAVRRFPAERYGGFLVSSAAHSKAGGRTPLLADGWNVRRQFMERISFIQGSVRERRALVRAAAGVACLLTVAFLLLALPFLAPLAADAAGSPPTGYPVDAPPDKVRVVPPGGWTVGGITDTTTVEGVVTFGPDGPRILGTSLPKEPLIVDARFASVEIVATVGTGGTRVLWTSPQSIFDATITLRDGPSGAITLSGPMVTAFVASLATAGRSGFSPADGQLFVVDEMGVRVLATADSRIAQLHRAPDGTCRITLLSDSGYLLFYSYVGIDTVSVGDRVAAGEPIGTLSSQFGPVVLYYRISRNGQSLDPSGQ